MEQIQTISFTQDELRLLITLIDISIQKGGLRLGDVAMVLPLAQKINEKIKVEPIKKTSVKPKNFN